MAKKSTGLGKGLDSLIPDFYDEDFDSNSAVSLEDMLGEDEKQEESNEDIVENVDEEGIHTVYVIGKATLSKVDIIPVNFYVDDDDVEDILAEDDFDEEEVKKYNVGTTLPVLIFMNQDKELFRLIGEKNYEEIMKAVGDVK